MGEIKYSECGLYEEDLKFFKDEHRLTSRRRCSSMAETIVRDSDLLVMSNEETQKYCQDLPTSSMLYVKIVVSLQLLEKTLLFRIELAIVRFLNVDSQETSFR